MRRKFLSLYAFSMMAMLAASAEAQCFQQTTDCQPVACEPIVYQPSDCAPTVCPPTILSSPCDQVQQTAAATCEPEMLCNTVQEPLPRPMQVTWIKSESKITVIVQDPPILLPGPVACPQTDGEECLRCCDEIFRDHPALHFGCILQCARQSDIPMEVIIQYTREGENPAPLQTSAPMVSSAPCAQPVVCQPVVCEPVVCEPCVPCQPKARKPFRLFRRCR